MHADRWRQVSFDQHGIVQPRDKDAIENDVGDVGLIDADGLEERLVVQAPRSVVVARRVARSS